MTKTKAILLRITTEEKRDYLDAANSHGLSVSVWLRQLAQVSLRHETAPAPAAARAGRQPSSDAGGGDFDHFWAAYPKRVGKDAARKAWRTKKPALGEVLAGLTGQLDWLARDNWKYCPNPATWLNQGRWQDTPPHVNLFVSERTAKNLAARELAMAQIALREPHTLAPDKESSS